MFYKNGLQFEEAVFGHHSVGLGMAQKFTGMADFATDLRTIIDKPHAPYPETRIGASLYFETRKQLERFGINSEGLLFLSTINTKADARHQTDGLFYLPSLFPNLVTVDTVYIKPPILLSQRDCWVESFDGEVYSDSDFQTDLFRYNKGFAESKKLGLDRFLFQSNLDLRQFTKCLRPENHFILTPIHAMKYGGRRAFAMLVAGYFAKVSGHKRPVDKA